MQLVTTTTNIEIKSVETTLQLTQGCSKNIVNDAAGALAGKLATHFILLFTTRDVRFKIDWFI